MIPQVVRKLRILEAVREVLDGLWHLVERGPVAVWGEDQLAHVFQPYRTVACHHIVDGETFEALAPLDKILTGALDKNHQPRAVFENLVTELRGANGPVLARIRPLPVAHPPVPR